MNETHFKQLLRQADSVSGLPQADVEELSSAVRCRLTRRKQYIRTGLLTAAAIAVIASIGIGLYRSQESKRKLADLRQREQLAKIEADLALVQQLLHQQEEQLSQLRANRFSSPARQIEKEMDDAAFVLMYQAERMARQYNDQQTALDYYQQVVQYFGRTQWAEEAQKRIAQLHSNSI